MAACTALENSLYREQLPNPYLSKTFQSSVLHTPSQTQRRTISKENSSRQIENDEKILKTPWGRKYSYGGTGFVQLQGTPHSLNMVKLSKGTHHFGAGASQKPRGVTIQQQYNILPTKRSSMRSTDELVPAPTKIDISKEQIDKRFPVEHTYTSHISKTELFPSTANPAKNTSGLDSQVIPPDCPTSAPDSIIIGKARGTPYRHELVSIPLDSQRKPATWPQGPTYFQVLKSSGRERNAYYPIPQSQLNPNALRRTHLSDATQRALEEANNAKWSTTYRSDFYKPNSPPSSIDTEDALKGITSLPNAEVPVALLHSNTSPDNNKMIDATIQPPPQEQSKTIEELSGETERQRRVEFMQNLSSNNASSGHIIENKQGRKYIIPQMYTSISRPSSTLPASLKDSSFQSRSKTAPISRPDLSYTFSPTDLIRVYNETYDTPPDIRRLRRTPTERRHYIPEANDTRSHIFDGY